jgi:hypothetical protein
MVLETVFLHSPFSAQTVFRHRALLLQFILSELVCTWKAHNEKAPPETIFSPGVCFYPYDWSKKAGSLNKIQEHARLLIHAFPTSADAVQQFHLALSKTTQQFPKSLSKNLKALYEELTPFLNLCQDHEQLHLFRIHYHQDLINFQPKDLK